MALLLCLSAGGCGTFVARRIARAPNSYPSWLAPKVRVLIAFDYDKLTNFPPAYVEVGPPKARLQYRVIAPAQYNLSGTSTNWLEHGKPVFRFDFHADVPGRTNRWSANPRGTVVLLHGYGLAEFAMVPWAFRLAQEGWCCVLVDLRGHGESTGKTIYFGVKESNDLTQLLDELAERCELVPPLNAVGESYGAALALRWKTEDSRVEQVIAIAPYGVLSNAVLNIRREYAPLLPSICVKAGVAKLPAVLTIDPDELNPATTLAKQPVVALFVAGTEDKIAPVHDVRALFERAAPKSQLITVPYATHESLAYHLPELVPAVLAWLSTNTADAAGPIEIRQGNPK